jgi:hypothetical protein
MVEIPEFLIGEYDVVRRRVHNISKRVLAGVSWSEILTESDAIPLETISGGIVVSCPYRQMQRKENIVTCTLFESLVEIGGDLPDRKTWYSRQADLIDQGLDYFWFALCLLAAGLDHLPFMTPPLSGALSRKSLSQRHLKKLFRWSEELDQNRRRLITCNGEQINGYDGPSFEGMIGDIGHIEDSRILHPLTMVQRSRIVLDWIRTE